MREAQDALVGAHRNTQPREAAHACRHHQGGRTALYQTMRRREISNTVLAQWPRSPRPWCGAYSTLGYASRIKGLHAALATLDVAGVVEDAA